MSRQVSTRAMGRQSFMTMDNFQEPKHERQDEDAKNKRQSISKLNRRRSSARGNANVDVVIDQASRHHYQRTLKLNDQPSITEFDLLTEIGEGMSATVRIKPIT